MTTRIVAGPTSATGRRGRMSPGVAAVEVDWKHVGWIRRFEDGWHGKLVDEIDYTTDAYPTRVAAADAVAERSAAA